MHLVKFKFSRIPVWEPDYMEKQNEYSFKTKEDLVVGNVYYHTKYHKYLHCTHVVLNADMNYFSKESNTFSKEQLESDSIKLGELKLNGEMYSVDYPVLISV